MRVVNFGSCNIDYVYSLDHIVEKGETEATNNMSIFPGGKGLNQSIALAKAEAEIYHAGFIGCDGKFLSDMLLKSGVNISHTKYTEEKNGHAIIQVSRDGENSIIIYPGSNHSYTYDYIDSVLNSFEKDDILLLQNEINSIDYIIDKAFEKGISIFFNPSPFKSNITALDFNKLSCIILNEKEAKELTGHTDTTSILKFFKESYPSLKVMLTLGKNGCIYCDENTTVKQPAFNVNCIDSTAAGDTFTGYFIAGITKNENISSILKTASAASAICVSKKGAAPSIPEKKEVENFLNEVK